MPNAPDIVISAQEMRSMLAAMAEGVVLQQADGRIRFCNTAAEHILGLSREQMEGRTSGEPLWRAVREDGSPFPGSEHPAMVALRTGDAVSHVVMGVHRPDGSLVWILINAEPVRERAGAPPRAVLTTFSDVTAQIDAAARLRQSEQQLRAYFDNPAIGIAIAAADGEWVRVNQRLCDMLATRLTRCRHTPFSS